MPSERQIVACSEPPHIEGFNWNSKCHVIPAIARLVEAVYILCREPKGYQDPALPCLDDFNFKLIYRLIDEEDKPIFGATFEYKGESLPNIPQFVIAFRGTSLKPETAAQDITLDKLCFGNRLHESSRFQHAMNYIHDMVTSPKGARVWLAGHSLGAAMALLAGKEMAKKNYLIETYLFNPPFCSDLITRCIKNESVNFGIQLTKNVAKLIRSRFGKDHQHQEAQANDAFNALSNWVPNIFVHPDDPICSAYIHYFKNRWKMLEFGFKEVERVAAMKTMRMVLGMDSSSEAMHLLPSAKLTINEVEFPREIPGLRVWIKEAALPCCGCGDYPIQSRRMGLACQSPQRPPLDAKQWAGIGQEEKVENRSHVCPYVEGFIVPGEDAEERVFERPLAPIIVQYVLIVSQVFRQLLVLHQSPLESLPFLFSLRFLRLLLSFRAGSIRTPRAFPASDTHRRRHSFP
ncbi:hypothetical protein SO802_000625 [Lithocarpus litseifolius]|uniref:Fungal lipase-type domain-containing protein n=1 Tax=Lithocarpus litseifolius TaxID=425828 RepID=A0AAW2DT12_9ROSI